MKIEKLSPALKTLAEERAKLITSMTNINKRELKGKSKDGDEKLWKRKEKRLDAIESIITKANRLAKIDNSQEEILSQAAEDGNISEDQQREIDQNYHKAFYKHLAFGRSKLTPEEIVILDKGGVDGDGERAQDSLVAASGGNTVSNPTMSKVWEALKAFGGMREVALIERTPKGNKISWPLHDGTSETGTWLAEQGAITETNTTFGSKDVEAWTAHSDVIKASVQFLQDSEISGIENWLMNILVTRLGRLTNAAYTVGDGSSKPEGVTTVANTNNLASNSAIAATEWIDMRYKHLDKAYWANATWMFNQTTLSNIRKLAGNDNFHWQPGLSPDAPDLLLGKQYTINNDMVDNGSGNKPVLFGDFKFYMIRDAQDIILIRLDELYAANLQRGFHGYLRTDGNLMAANTGAQNPIQAFRGPTT